MKSFRRVVSLGVAAVALVLPTWAAAEDRVAHVMKVGLDPATHQLTVSTVLTLPASSSSEFLLSAKLEVTEAVPAVEEVPLGDLQGFFGINSSDTEALGPEGLKRYRLSQPPPEGRLSLEYAGPFDYSLSDPKEQYTRGFRSTAGRLAPEGVYLSGASFWYPHVGQGLLEFELEVTQPEGWHVISQGNGTSRDASGVARWDSHGPMDEIYLVGGPLQVARDSAGAVETLVYLHEMDEALAKKYLTATAQYVEMYRGLIGPYPYGKFALVENFWETGYGMPSFTLLGPQVIRFPFILHSSYPHEILHNWWGNSVFVDYESGNWCEGLTAYLADHLIQEQRGKGHEYRRSTLQKYRDYVKQSRDFPLTEFRSRHSAATEAVGYGKALMGFHMLRRDLGDEAFRRTLARAYRELAGKKASFRDLQKVAESVSGQDLGPFFDDWITRAGAATLEVAATGVAEEAGRFVVSGVLRQVQGGAPFGLDVPVVVQISGGMVSETVHLGEAEQAFSIVTSERPLAVHVDPEFDVFRRLDPRETPPSIGQLFGEPRILALLPGQAEDVDMYRELMEGWRSDSHEIELKAAEDFEKLPSDRPVWLLGHTNRFAPPLFHSLPGVSLKGGRMKIEGEVMPLAGHTGVLVARHPENVDKAVGWIFVDPPAAGPGLGRKLPHYGKYSYLGFEGEEPTNVIKGQWPASDSPLRVDLRQASDSAALSALRSPPRRALAELPPVFSQTTLLGHVSHLASPALEGRGIGSKGLQTAAGYVADQLREAGLAPGGDGGTYFQTFTVPEGPDGQPHEVSNVIGLLPGTESEWAGQSLLVTAHYDHLGHGWPEARKGSEGQLHPGADDNASGVAVMLELARNLAAEGRPKRTTIFVAFVAEEAGLLGSKHYVEHAAGFPLEEIIGVINLDTVGRLGDEKLSVLGTGTADEWQHIFRGGSFVTGVESRNIPEATEASDQRSFIEKGVPAVQIFTGAHLDYHRPGDTPDKIDGPGLVKVATFVKEAVAYLGERPEPMNVTIAVMGFGPKAAEETPARPRGRRVSFGIVPDFAFQGPGVRATSVVPDSPAAKAGVEGGDVLLRIGDQSVESLSSFSDILKGLQPGQTIRVVLKRAGEEVVLSVTVVAR